MALRAGSVKKATGSCRSKARRLDGLPNVASELVVQADHLRVHRHPQSILEVRRILIEQVTELQSFPLAPADVMVASADLPRGERPPPNASDPSATVPPPAPTALPQRYR